jgi:hypothetical protein
LLRSRKKLSLIDMALPSPPMMKQVAQGAPMERPDKKADATAVLLPLQ